MDDLRRATRALAKAPIFAGVAVISLGLALALNTTMFALVDAVLHPYVPYPHPERIAAPLFHGGDMKHWVTWDARFAEVRDGMHSYDRISSYMSLGSVTVQTGASSSYQWVTAVGPAAFDVLDVHPMLGRVFDAADFGAENGQVAVISFRLWNRLFNGRPVSDALTLDVASTRYAVIGVMPRGVHLPGFSETDIWIPSTALPVDASIRRFGPIPILRLRPGVTAAMFRHELAGIAARLTTEYTPQHPLYAAPMFGVGGPAQTGFPYYITATVAMVLIIACANLGTMMLARGMARRRETAIRIALGAARRDIVREVLCEGAIVGAAGVALGLLLTWWALYILPHYTIPSVPELGDLLPAPSWRVFCFALSITLATILLAGALPALRAAATDPAEPMKEGSATSTGRLRDRYNPLIVVEVALSTALLMCSALFVVVAVRLAAFDFQYAAKQLVTANITPSAKSIRRGEEPQFWDDVIVRAAHLPRARFAATQASASPDGRVIYSEQGKAGNAWMNANGYTTVSADYFRTMGITIVGGRDFEPGDARGNAPVAIVDERAARRLWPDVRDPVGHMLKLGRLESPAPWIRVVGVAQAIEYMPRRDIDLPPDPIVYVLLPDDSTRGRTLLVRSDGVNADRGRAALALAVQQMVQTQLPTQGGLLVGAWLDYYDGMRAKSEFMASLYGAFAGFGLVLCAVGLYGVLAYTVSRRLRELAVRVALGARRRDVVRLVVHDAAVTALAGVGIGAFLALWFTLPIIEGLDIMSVAYVPVVALAASESLLFVVAFVASLGPLRRAANADPLEIIRAI